MVAYYYDYKAYPKEFSLSIKTLGKGLLKGLIFVALYFGINKAYEMIVPINKNHGIEFNSEREKLGIPTLKSDWKLSEYDSEQFETSWWKNTPQNGHFKKIIKYGVLNCKSETDYYQNEEIANSFAWSIYDFEKSKFEYFIELPNKNLTSYTESGRLKIEKPTVVKKVDKSEFENYIAEIN
jgi:hypothetical protein